MEKDEEVLVSKLRWKLLPFLSIAFLLSFLDRSNVGNVHSVMLNDTGITEEEYVTGVSVFFITYILCELPSNIMLKRTSGPVWFSRIMISWGIISTCFMFIKDFTGLAIARVFLGAAEAGFLPGILFYLTLWFNPTERAWATGIFVSSVPLAGMVSGLAAYGILQMDGLANLQGWQWLFLIEGIPSILAGMASLWVLPASPSKATWLSEEEKELAIKRLHSRTFDSEPFALAHFKNVFFNPRFWCCAVCYLCMCCTGYATSYFLPSIIEQFGFSTLISNLLTAPIYFSSFVGLVLNGMHSDKTKERYFHVFFPCLLALLGWGVTSITLLWDAHSPNSPSSTPWLLLQYAALMLILIGYNMTLPILLTWNTEFLVPASPELSIASAFMVGFGNLGGIIGPQLISLALSLSVHKEGYGWGAFSLSLVTFVGVIFAAFTEMCAKRRNDYERV